MNLYAFIDKEYVPCGSFLEWKTGIVIYIKTYKQPRNTMKVVYTRLFDKEKII